MPKVSVLVPTHNRADYLPAAIASVQVQTFADWELIVVDDGSTDNTRELIDQPSLPVRYICQANRGVSAARNRAFRESVGDYVLFLDSDDLLLSNSLQVLSAALDENPSVDVVYSDGYIIDEAGTRRGDLSTYRRFPVEDTLEYFVLAGPVVSPGSAMIRRGVLGSLGGPFDEQMVGYEDWDLFMRLKAAGARFMYLPQHTCCYRFHGENKSAPRSRFAERRRQSLVHNRMKVLRAPWFSTLSLPARYEFFLGFLTGPLREDCSAQEQVFADPAFRQMSARDRARLLYRVAAENSLGDIRWNQEFRHLAEAIRLHPLNPRPYFLLALSLLGPALRRRVLQSWRRARAAPDGADPVSQILRARNVA